MKGGATRQMAGRIIGAPVIDQASSDAPPSGVTPVTHGGC
jgi:hypothetical protein